MCSQCAYIRIEKTEALTGARVWTNYDDEEETVVKNSNTLPGEVHVPAEDAPGDDEDADDEEDEGDDEDDDDDDIEPEPVTEPEPVKPVKKERKKAVARKP